MDITAVAVASADWGVLYRCADGRSMCAVRCLWLGRPASQSVLFIVCSGSTCSYHPPDCVFSVTLLPSPHLQLTTNSLGRAHFLLAQWSIADDDDCCRMMVVAVVVVNDSSEWSSRFDRHLHVLLSSWLSSFVYAFLLMLKLTLCLCLAICALHLPLITRRPLFMFMLCCCCCCWLKKKRKRKEGCCARLQKSTTTTTTTILHSWFQWCCSSVVHQFSSFLEIVKERGEERGDCTDR